MTLARFAQDYDQLPPGEQALVAEAVRRLLSDGLIWRDDDGGPATPLPTSRLNLPIAAADRKLEQEAIEPRYALGLLNKLQNGRSPWPYQS